ncbi:MAG: DinB family protein [Chloroflexota bacterium]|nr:DinB family protein [Chloroflexota bacterium]
MITPQQLADAYALNLRLIQMQTDILSHADSLVQTPYNLNSLNWVIGHITVNRDNVLRLLGEEALLTETQTARYQRGSEPVTLNGDNVIRLERLLEILQQGQEKLTEAITRLTPEELTREILVGEHTMSLGHHLFGFYFHDTYHTGQTDLLRQVAGVDNEVVK